MVDNFIIVSPSIHIYNGSKANAEILINHTPITGGKQLVVAIPIKESSDTSSASDLLTEIIQGVSSGAPVKGETTNLNISNFTLSTFVPVKPYYSYEGTNKLQSNDYIVFDLLDAISLNNDTLTTLSEIVTEFPIPTPGKSLFYNENGPNKTKGGGDGIYISCKPTGSSEEETDVEYEKEHTENNLFSLDKSTRKIVAQVLISTLIFVVLFGIIGYTYSYFSGTPIKIPTIDKMPTMPSLPSFRKKSQV
jgi:hypothetical protein